jgi:2-oxoglutarate ferredoxin oxidoreductase subunit delta
MARKSGTVEIEVDLCKGCDLCVVVCPENVLEMTDEMNVKGWPVVVLARPGCTGCALCARACPDGVFTVFQDTGPDDATASGERSAP